jgi:hypothetical protein
MAKKTKQAKSAAPYFQRLAQDEYVQEQLRNAVGRLSEAYSRVRRKRGEAAEDKKLYANIREAATSIRKAVGGLQRKPEPKRRGRKFLIAAGVAGGTGVLLNRRKKAKAGLSADGGAAPESAGLDSGGASQETLAREPVGGSAGN